MLIAIPSKGRPYRSKSKEFLKDAKLFVPESEYRLYNQVYPNDIVAVPNDVRGITPTRNWILRNTDEKEVVMVDDDLVKCGYLMPDETGKINTLEIKDGKILERVFEQAFETLYSLGWKVFGVRGESSAWGQHNENPFLFDSYITANCMGIINDGTMYFDEKMVVKEDFELGLRHMEMFGGVLCIRYLFWSEKHWTTDGGCADYRHEKVERDAINRLLKLYPKRVRKVSKKGNVYDIRLNTKKS